MSGGAATSDSNLHRGSIFMSLGTFASRASGQERTVMQASPVVAVLAGWDAATLRGASGALSWCRSLLITAVTGLVVVAFYLVVLHDAARA